MLPLKRARLFISKCPPHVKMQYAEDCDLHIGMTWQQFKQKMAVNWVVAFKKRRMRIDIGLDVPEIKPSDAPAVPPVVPTVPAFASGVGDSNSKETMIALTCREEGCGVSFQYSQEKIDWMKDHFKERFRMPSRCPTHKAAADASRSSNPDSSKPPENPVSVPAQPIIPATIENPRPANRFGSRRTPNEKV